MSLILLATDGSEHANTASALVASISWPPETLVCVLSVVPSLPELAGLPWTPVAPSNIHDVEEAELQRANRTTWAAVDTLRSAGLKAECSVLRGHPADVIAEFARRQGADLIVMGSRGLGTFEAALLGSVSSRVIDRAPCPVLVARSDRLGRTVVADDGSPEAEAARAFVLARPYMLGDETCLVGVAPTQSLWPDMLAPVDARTYEIMVESRTAIRHGLASRIGADAAELVAAGVVATHEVRDGNPAREIVAAAEAREAGLIVVGTHGRHGALRLAIGSVSRAVVHGARCSVLVVRALPVGRPRPQDDRSVGRMAGRSADASPAPSSVMVI